MSIKMIELEKWMQYKVTREGADIMPCEPIFNRDGYYYDTHTKKCWFEVDGDAFEFPAHEGFGFRYRLEQLNHRPLRQNERDALIILSHSGLISKEQKKLFAIDCDYLELIQVKYDARKLRKKFINRIKDRKENSAFP